MKKIILLFLGCGITGFIASYAMAGNLLLTGWAVNAFMWA